MQKRANIDEIRKEIDVMLWSADLEMQRRYLNMTYWETESAEERIAEASRSGPRLESVADHSWHLCDCILLLASHFSSLDILKCLKIAILHDKLELFTGDFAPQGISGTGNDGTAFNRSASENKYQLEMKALYNYIYSMPLSAAKEQKECLQEFLELSTPEARFVSAIDKIQVYTFLLRKKRGNMSNKHIEFSIKYVRKGVAKFPLLLPYVEELEDRLINTVAVHRGVPRATVEKEISLADLLASSIVRQ